MRIKSDIILLSGLRLPMFLRVKILRETFLKENIKHDFLFQKDKNQKTDAVIKRYLPAKGRPFFCGVSEGGKALREEKGTRRDSAQIICVK